jgi:hypothetical protein
LTQGFEDYEDLLGAPLSQVRKGRGTDGAAEGGVAGRIHMDLRKYKQSLKNATEAAKGADEL